MQRDEIMKQLKAYISDQVLDGKDIGLDERNNSTTGMGHYQFPRNRSFAELHSITISH
jgi:hypothetical protein